MTKPIWIVLLRGVNVCGHNKLPMVDFRAVLGNCGYDGVATYIQSGNAVFRADGTADEIAKCVAAKLQSNFGLSVDVFVRNKQDFDAAIAQYPFPAACEDPKTLHLFFLAQSNPDFDAEALSKLATNDEEYRLIDDVFYLYTPNGFGRSGLAAKVGSVLKTTMTARNLRSCHKIAELARSASA